MAGAEISFTTSQVLNARGACINSSNSPLNNWIISVRERTPNIHGTLISATALVWAIDFERRELLILRKWISWFCDSAKVGMSLHIGIPMPDLLIGIFIYFQIKTKPFYRLPILRVIMRSWIAQTTFFYKWISRDYCSSPQFQPTSNKLTRSILVYVWIR